MPTSSRGKSGAWEAPKELPRKVVRARPIPAVGYVVDDQNRSGHYYLGWDRDNARIMVRKDLTLYYKGKAEIEVVFEDDESDDGT